MYVECLIKRSDGSDTFVDFEQVRYRFPKNSAGHHVCFVGSESHRRQLLSMGADSYRLYKPPKNLTGPQGAAPEPMTPNILRKKNKHNQINDMGDAIEAATREPDKPVLVDYDWDLPEKVAKVKEFKFQGADGFRSYVDNHRDDVMKWPIDVRRELAKKLDNMMPDEDPGIEGFVIDDYLRNRSPGDT